MDRVEIEFQVATIAQPRPYQEVYVLSRSLISRHGSILGPWMAKKRSDLFRELLERTHNAIHPFRQLKTIFGGLTPIIWFFKQFQTCSSGLSSGEYGSKDTLRSLFHVDNSSIVYESSEFWCPLFSTYISKLSNCQPMMMAGYGK